MAAAASTVLPPITSVVTIRLSRDNHMMWKAQVLAYLRTHCLFPIASGDEAAPAKAISSGTGDSATQVPNPAYAVWYHKDQTILGGILATVSEDVLPHIMMATSAAGAWGTLETLFAARSRARINQIRTQMATPRRRDVTGADYYKAMKIMADTLAAIGEPLRPSEIISYVLAGLGQEYESLISSLNVKDDLQLDEVYAHLLGYDQRQETYQAEVQLGNSSVSYAGMHAGNTTNHSVHYSGKQGGQGRGHQGGGQGQGHGGGRGRGGGGRGNGSHGGGQARDQGTRPQCQLCGKLGHVALKCFKRFNKSYHGEPEQHTANVTSYQVDPNWYMDTGATDHITSDLDRLSFRERYNGNDTVQVGNGAGSSVADKPPGRQV